MLTKEQLDTYDNIQFLIQDFAEQFNEAFGLVGYTIDDHYIEAGILEISTSSGGSGCYDNYSLSCPVELMYDDNWKATERDRLDVIIMENTFKQVAQRKAAKEADEKDRHELYLELKKEYGNN